MSDSLECTYNGCAHAVSSSNFKHHFVRRHLGGDATLYNTMHRRMFLRPIPMYTDGEGVSISSVNRGAASSSSCVGSTMLQLAAQLAAQSGGLDVLPADAREALGKLVAALMCRPGFVKEEERGEKACSCPQGNQAPTQTQEYSEGEADSTTAAQRNSPCNHGTSDLQSGDKQEMSAIRKELMEMRQALQHIQAITCERESRLSGGCELNEDEERAKRRSPRLLCTAQPAAKKAKRTKTAAAENTRRSELASLTIGDFFDMLRKVERPAATQESQLVKWDSTRRNHGRPTSRSV
ncbi:hypothetical protein PINS_up011619 [Pythium insidiosum]|nr:hypothetical protein PINS_up011619 [Pythium insidiosum]